MHASETGNLHVTQRTRLSLQILLWYMISFLITTTFRKQFLSAIQHGLDILKSFNENICDFCEFIPDIRWH